MARQFVGKVSYALLANIISFVVSIVTTLLVPKLMGNDLEGYGYFQLYFFYEAYIGFFHLGLIDGLYLKDGGKDFNSLSRQYYSNQFQLLSLFEVIVGLLIIASSLFSNSVDTGSIIIYIGLSIILYLPANFIMLTLQATYRIKEYAIATILGRCTFFLSIVAALVLSRSEYHIFVIGDLCGKLVSLLVGLFYCHELVLSTRIKFIDSLKDALDNIRVGINLLAANIADSLINGVVRFAVQLHWSIVTFGILSLAISISNMLLVLINAVAIVLYPALRKTDTARLPSLYTKIRDVLMLVVFGLLVLYYPMAYVLGNWIPQYSDSLHYMAVLFPMCAYASKKNLLIVTYLQVYRMEKTIFKVNLVGVAVAVITTAISVYLFDSLFLAVLSILVNQAFRCIYADLKLSKVIQLKIWKDIIYELALTSLFVLGNWFIEGISGTLIYVFAYVIYLYIKRSSIKSFISN